MSIRNMMDSAPDSEAVLFRFNRLIQELLRGVIKRNCFRPWEIELLLDIDACDLRGAKRRETIQRYQRAVQRQMENGAAMPVKLSEYLANRRSRGKKSSATEDQTARGRPLNIS